MSRVVSSPHPVIGGLAAEQARQRVIEVDQRGDRRIIGNHVVVEIDDAVYAVFAHLKRGSIQTHKGQRIRTTCATNSIGWSFLCTPPDPHRRSPVSGLPKLGCQAGWKGSSKPCRPARPTGRRPQAPSSGKPGGRRSESGRTPAATGDNPRDTDRGVATTGGSRFVLQPLHMLGGLLHCLRSIIRVGETLRVL